MSVKKDINPIFFTFELICGEIGTPIQREEV